MAEWLENGETRMTRGVEWRDENDKGHRMTEGVVQYGREYGLE